MIFGIECYTFETKKSREAHIRIWMGIRRCMSIDTDNRHILSHIYWHYAEKWRQIKSILCVILKEDTHLHIWTHTTTVLWNNWCPILNMKNVDQLVHPCSKHSREGKMLQNPSLDWGFATWFVTLNGPGGQIEKIFVHLFVCSHWVSTKQNSSRKPVKIIHRQMPKTLHSRDWITALRFTRSHAYSIWHHVRGTVSVSIPGMGRVRLSMSV